MTSDVYSEMRSAPDPLDVPQRALAIGAHPDDIEFGAGGTLARWAGEGCAVTMLVVTDGSKGTWDPDRDPAELAQARRAEQAAAAATLGAGPVVHLDEVDGELQVSMRLRARLCREIRQAKPDVVLTHDPWQRYQLHPDHRATGTLALDGIVAARDPLFYPDQGVAPHRPKAVLLWSADAPDHAEPIDASIDTKIAALLCHSSQGTTTMGGAELGDAQRDAFAERVRSWAREAGDPFGIDMAERFKRLTP